MADRICAHRPIPSQMSSAADLPATYGVLYDDYAMRKDD